MTTKPDAELRDSLKQVDTEDCWHSASTPNHADYGVIQQTINGKNTARLAHRVMYENMVGPIPEGLVLDHLCFVPACINPDHLEPVTTRVNTQRYYRTVTHCKRGHAFTEDNTYRQKSKPSGRICRECVKQRIDYIKTGEKYIFSKITFNGKKRFYAYGTINGKKVHLGVANTLEEAIKLRDSGIRRIVRPMKPVELIKQRMGDSDGRA